MPTIDLSAVELAARESAGSGHFPVQTILSTFASDVLPVLRSLGIAVDADAVVALLKATVWDSIVVPFDIPYIPAGLETRLEAFAWRHLEDGIRTLLETVEPADSPQV